MSAPENPQAFPGGAPSKYDGSVASGMSLRDYFAGQALAMSMPDSPQHLADWAYRVADAMVAERAKAVRSHHSDTKGGGL
jgi:hypothetical protein